MIAKTKLKSGDIMPVPPMPELKLRKDSKQNKKSSGFKLGRFGSKTFYKNLCRHIIKNHKNANFYLTC